jgi:hypothetical protein
MVELIFQPAERIEALEREIDELRDAIARSRRLMTAGRVAAVAGPALLIALIFGLLGFSPARVLVALALLIGGIVLTGSSKSSTAQLEGSLAQAERERNAAIDALGLVPAGDGPE